MKISSGQVRRGLLIAAFILCQALLLYASTFSGSPAVGGDDGFDGSGFDNTNVNTEMGDHGTANMRSFFRFPNVTIAQGSTISAATVQFTARFNDAGVTCNLNIYFQNADNAAAPADTAGIDTAFAAATAAVSWPAVPVWVANGDALAAEKTPDIASILQTVVNRGGFASGNAVLLLIQNNASSLDAYRRPRTVEAGSGLAVLDVTYTAGAAAAPTRALFTGVGK